MSAAPLLKRLYMLLGSQDIAPDVEGVSSDSSDLRGSQLRRHPLECYFLIHVRTSKYHHPACKTHTLPLSLSPSHSHTHTLPTIYATSPC